VVTLGLSARGVCKAPATGTANPHGQGFVSSDRRSRTTDGSSSLLFLEELTQTRTVTLNDDEPTLRLAMAMIESELSAPRCGQPEF
jgi:hypothetical protein